ncbi:hypothetical protein GCM10016272_01580 [Psychrobacter glaciei]|uniref:Uncharacterized protein n=1 Tax=Psychrobacter glaciei TaxID=619771 RepID=A0ABQ3GNJ3_9GAMM|nr:hypothetical protein [Psychrobacter glaciei]GHD25586.1 hypothetical protein GCM10016272_01580 [Psychrobacter glaciei]
MTLSTAYSIDLNKDINAEDADIAFQKKEISSQKDFRCPNEKCRIAVTCANLEKPKVARKVDPYFRSVEDHSENCPFAVEEARDIKPETSDSYYDGVDTTKGNTLINLAPPPPKPQDSESTDVKPSKKPSPQSSSKRKDSEHNNDRTKRISSLVTSFLNGENFDVTLPHPYAEDISLQDLFIEINGQDISDLDQDTLRIYYGEAWINTVYNGYQIRFGNDFLDASQSDKELRKQPTLYIHRDKIKDAPYKKYREIRNLIGPKKKDVFILSHAPALSADGKYINFTFTGFQYLEVIA